MKYNKKKPGIVFWITGLSGSGKSTIGNFIKKYIDKNYGKTIIIHGDDIRNIYHLRKYQKKERLNLGISNSNLCKLISSQGINVIFTTVGLFYDLHKYNRSNIKNYIEIYVKSDIKTLVRNKKKKFYMYKTKLIWGLDIKPEFPINPDIIINNNFKISLKFLSKKLIESLKKIVI
jgi:adenylylsulfate kinase-like enzyme